MGKELIFAILHPGLSVCELLLFSDKKYPVNAVFLEASTIIKLEKSEFEKMLDEQPKYRGTSTDSCQSVCTINSLCSKIMPLLMPK